MHWLFCLHLLPVLLFIVLPLPLVLALPLLQPHKLGQPLYVDLRAALDWHPLGLRAAPQEAAERCEAAGGQVHRLDALLSHPRPLLLTEVCRHGGGARDEA